MGIISTLPSFWSGTAELTHEDQLALATVQCRVGWGAGELQEALNQERRALLLRKGLMPADEWHGSEACCRLQSAEAERLPGGQARSTLHASTRDPLSPASGSPLVKQDTADFPIV